MPKAIPVVVVLILASLTFAPRSRAADLEVRRDVEFAKLGGVSIALDAYLQPGDAKSPAVVFVHGGGFVSGDKKDYAHDLLDPLTGAGFAVFSVNYRLAPKHPFPAATDDVESAIAFIKQHAAEFRVDPNRLALMGPSADGLLVSYVGAKHRPENRVAAVVSLYGEHDLVLRALENPCSVDGHTIPRPKGGCISSGLAALLGFGEIKSPQDEERLRNASAITFVKKDMPPYLLLHGTRDFGVPFEQSVSMQHAMDEARADCTLIGIVGGGHGGWEKLPQWKKERERMVEWVKEKTKG